MIIKIKSFSHKLKMDLQVLYKGLDFAKKRKKWVVLLALFGASSYGAYKVYNIPSLARKRRKLLRLFNVFFSVVELVFDSSETIGVMSRDLKDFLSSSSDEIPNSFRQVSKIGRSTEFSDALTRVSEALTVGILRGYSSESRNLGDSGRDGGVADRVVDRILSNEGTGFVSAVVGSFTRNLVMGIQSGVELNGGSNGNENVVIDGVDSSRLSEFVNVVCNDKSKELIANCVQVFVSTAVEVYLDKTLDINFYDEIFAGLTNPNHESKMRNILISVCNGAVETLVKTSHQVLASNKTIDSNSSCSIPCAATDVGEFSNMNGCELGDGAKGITHSTSAQISDRVENGSWGSVVLSTLSVPSNRRFVLDVTGRVTFETFRSIIEFSSLKLLDGLKSSGNDVYDQFKYKGREVVTYFGLKSFVAVIICLALYLHIIGGTKSFVASLDCGGFLCINVHNTKF